MKSQLWLLVMATTASRRHWDSVAEHQREGIPQIAPAYIDERETSGGNTEWQPPEVIIIKTLSERESFWLSHYHTEGHEDLYLYLRTTPLLTQALTKKWDWNPICTAQLITDYLSTSVHRVDRKSDYKYLLPGWEATLHPHKSGQAQIIDMLQP